MKLSSLLEYNPITIQCHDNPDADAIASSYALCRYFESQGKEVRFVYLGVGEVSKPNLKLMIGKLGIKAEYVSSPKDLLMQYGKDSCPEVLPGLLITVDCQYGGGNVTLIPAEKVAIIDHHRVETSDYDLSEIKPNWGSCSTVVWHLLNKENFDTDDINLGTALFYGLYADTNGLTEMSNPHDMDMRDTLNYDKSLISQFKNSNLSLHELEIAGIALIKYIYNDEYLYTIIKAAQCDPNVLGLISDFVIQVAEVNSCIVYNEWPDGFKFSVRSCVKEVRADELAAFIASGIGSGGGHSEKAGGFISKDVYAAQYPTLHTEAFFGSRYNEYFDGCDIIYAKDYRADISSMKLYERRRMAMGAVDLKDIVKGRKKITIRTTVGDMEIKNPEEKILVIQRDGFVRGLDEVDFAGQYEMTDQLYLSSNKVKMPDYLPKLRDPGNPEYRIPLADYAKVCIHKGGQRVFAKKLTRRVKVFQSWNEEEYLLGKVGDYLVVDAVRPNEVFVENKETFAEMFSHVDRKGGN